MKAKRSAMPATFGINSQIRRPATFVAIGLNSPRTSTGASGFRSIVSRCGGPPSRWMLMTDLADPAIPAAASASSRSASVRPPRPSAPAVEEVAPADAAPGRFAERREHDRTPTRGASRQPTTRNTARVYPRKRWAAMLFPCWLAVARTSVAAEGPEASVFRVAGLNGAAHLLRPRPWRPPTSCTGPAPIADTRTRRRRTDPSHGSPHADRRSGLHLALGGPRLQSDGSFSDSSSAPPRPHTRQGEVHVAEHRPAHAAAAVPGQPRRPGASRCRSAWS